MKIVIVGNGVWGNALYSVVSQNCKEVTIARRGEKITADVVILAVPTQSIPDVLPLITFLDKKIIVNTCKGIAHDTHKFPYEIVAQYFGTDVRYFSLMGPSFAEEVVQKMPTLVNLGYQSMQDREIVQPLFQTPQFFIRPTQAVEALELAGALKNVYAIVCGIADGLGYRTNTKTQLICLAIEEMHRLFAHLHLSVDESITPEMIGDLILTCSSGSRNFNFGKLLPSHSVQDALARIASTVEGYNTVQSLAYLEEKSKITLPIASFVRHIIDINSPEDVKASFDQLFTKSQLK